MRDSDCVQLLRWALPRLGLRWEGFRRVRRQVCKRVARRVAELGLDGVAAYRQYVEVHDEEATILDGLCRIPISRFYRDRAVFDTLTTRVLPALAIAATARGDTRLRVWSAGCAAGEEPYTVALAWRSMVNTSPRRLTIEILATDANPTSLDRARRACYPASSLKDLPVSLQDDAFSRREGLFCLREDLRREVELRLEDIRERMPDGPFHLILCRNVIFTYFDESLQRRLAARLVERLLPGGALVLGAHERLPHGMVALTADRENPAINWLPNALASG